MRAMKGCWLVIGWLAGWLLVGWLVALACTHTHTVPLSPHNSIIFIHQWTV
jgi:hypothetical protein